MAVQGGEDVYASLLTNDAYLPGALVLAHSLRDAGTTKKLAVLVTPDTVSAEVTDQLKTVYDYVIPVPRIRNSRPANLQLMNRPDLHSAFTKINLWKQTQFRKIVYIDADVVAYRAPDELFDVDHAFSAAPDIGWPDLFNTGVMVLTPSMGDYYALAAMAERGISFDGADQGLLNMYFKGSYNRLSFTYNVTPSAHYQYLPAYRHFQSSINMVHFIGTDKPWFQGRHAPISGSPYDEMVGRWWAVYDRHYRVPSTTPTPGPTETEPSAAPPPAQPVSELVQYFVKGEYHPPATTSVSTGEHYRDAVQQHPYHHHPAQTGGFEGGGHYEQPVPPPHFQYQEQYQEQYHEDHHQGQPPHHHHGEQHYQGEHHQGEHHHVEHHGGDGGQHYDHAHHQHRHDEHHQDPQPGTNSQQHEHPHPPPSESFANVQGTETEARKDHIPEHQPWVHHHAPEEEPPARPQPEVNAWDAQWHPPPADSKPEALNFPQEHYEMSQDPAQFVAPERYPSPPRDMWYEVPREPPAPSTDRPRPIFPWEGHQPKPSRVWGDYPPPSGSWHHDHQQQRQHGPADSSSEPTATTSGQQQRSSQAEPESSFTGSSTLEHKSEPATPPSVWAHPATPGPTRGAGGEPQQEHQSQQHRHYQPPYYPPSRGDPWSTFTRTNAWDEVPGIERYVTKHHHRGGKGSGGPGTPRGGSFGPGVGGFGGWPDSGPPPGGYYDEDEDYEDYYESGGAAAGPQPWKRRRSSGHRVTDFPSELERPSLPVTPAPVRRQRFWGPAPGGFTVSDDPAMQQYTAGDKAVGALQPGESGGGSGGETMLLLPGGAEAATALTRGAFGAVVGPGGGTLPSAAGVPSQTDWVCLHGVLYTPRDCLCDLTNAYRYYKDPVAQLQKLARQQSELLLRRFGGVGAGDDGDDEDPEPDGPRVEWDGSGGHGGGGSGSSVASGGSATAKKGAADESVKKVATTGAVADTAGAKPTETTTTTDEDANRPTTSSSAADSQPSPGYVVRPTAAAAAPEPTTVLSPRPVKGVAKGASSAGESLLRGLLAAGGGEADEDEGEVEGEEEEEEEDTTTTPKGHVPGTGTGAARPGSGFGTGTLNTRGDDAVPRFAEQPGEGQHIEAPSYMGPGAAWERGEDWPQMETPALPTDEERDVLDT